MIMAHCEFCTSQHQAEFGVTLFWPLTPVAMIFQDLSRIVAVDHVAEMSALSTCSSHFLSMGSPLKPQKEIMR